MRDIRVCLLYMLQAGVVSFVFTLYFIVCIVGSPVSSRARVCLPCAHFRHGRAFCARESHAEMVEFKFLG